MRNWLAGFFILLCASCVNPGKVVELRNEQGQLLERYQITADSLKEGLYQAFDRTGKLVEEAYYKSGLLHGQRKIFYPDEKIEIVENYQQGRMHGDYLHYYTSGALSFKADYEDNVLQGISYRYYPSGSIMEEVSFRENRENGPFVEYYENGNKKWEGTYLNGDNEVGELHRYDENGELQRTLLCDSLSICQTIWLKGKGKIELKNLRQDAE